MTKFDAESAAEARRTNPDLTVFDTGEMLEPFLREDRRPLIPQKEPTVDFDDAESTTYFSVFAHPSTIEDDTTVIQIDTVDGGKYKVVLNDGVLFNGDIEKTTEVDDLLDHYYELLGRDASGYAYIEFAHEIARALKSLHNEGN